MMRPWFKFNLNSTVSLTAMTIYAPPTLKELGGALYRAGQMLGIKELRSRRSA